MNSYISPADEAYYSLIDPVRMKGWVGLVGWPTADGLPIFSRSTDVTSTDLVSARGKTKEVYCCDIVVLIVLFRCFWCVKDYNVVSVYLNIVWWSYKMISISWLLFSPLPKPGQLTSVDRENKWLHISCRSGADQWKFAGQRPTFYHWATQPT